MKSILSIFVLINTLSLFSQSYLDEAIQYSNIDYQGTARSQGLSSAMGSLGGDLTAISINPAGLGIYRASEFSFTPGSYQINNNSTYLGKKLNSDKNSYHLNSIGFIMAKSYKNPTGVLNGSFAFAANKVANFNQNFQIEGNNPTISFAQYLTGTNAEPDQLDPFWEDLAWVGRIIDFDTVVNDYVTDFDNSVHQKQERNRTGGITDYSIGYGFNINHRLYLGLNFSVLTGKYIESFSITETDVLNQSDLNYYTYHHEVETQISGFQFKIGSIFRPVENYRLGIAIHLPTFYNLTDLFDADLTIVEDNGYVDYIQPSNLDGERIYPGEEDKTITSPFHLFLSNSIIFNQKGLLSIDYRLTDYRNIHLGSSNGFYGFSDNSDRNETIRENLKLTHNFRIGAEYKLGSIYLRSGYAFDMSPYGEKLTNNGFNKHSFSVGSGYRDSNFFTDLAFVLGTNQYKSSFYPDEIADQFLTKSKTYRLVFSIGFRFN